MPEQKYNTYSSLLACSPPGLYSHYPNGLMKTIQSDSSKNSRERAQSTSGCELPPPKKKKRNKETEKGRETETARSVIEGNYDYVNNDQNMINFIFH